MAAAMKRCLLVSVLFLLIAAPVVGQATYTLVESSKVWVDGTSNRDDWTVYAESIEGQVALEAVPDSGLPVIQEATFSVLKRQLKSRKSSIMDRLMHKTLKATQNNAITFVLAAAEVTPLEDGMFSIAATGDLTLAGESKPIELTLHGTITEDGVLQLTGTYPMLLSNHGMEPPTALYGALRTGDEVVVNFDVHYAISQ